MDYYKLDEKDIVILKTLAKDSRTKLSTLAENIGTSIPTIKSRIDKLEALQIIQQFSIILSYELLSDHPGYFVLVKTIPKAVSEILEFIIGNERILEAHELIGPYQIMVKTVPISTKDFQSLMNNLRERDGILEITPMSIAVTMKHEISKIPSQDIQVKIRCEYCGKQIEKDYQTLTVNDVTHFFCCRSCSDNYKNKSKLDE